MNIYHIYEIYEQVSKQELCMLLIQILIQILIQTYTLLIGNKKENIIIILIYTIVTL